MASNWLATQCKLLICLGGYGDRSDFCCQVVHILCTVHLCDHPTHVAAISDERITRVSVLHFLQMLDKLFGECDAEQRSLALSKLSTMGVLGASGQGKTTTLNCLLQSCADQHYLPEAPSLARDKVGAGQV